MKLIVANLKSSMLKTDLSDYLKGLKDLSYENLILVPSDIFISDFLKVSESVGVQNVSIYDKPNHTGSITAKQLESLGIRYCIVGHMEVRENYHETNELISDKVRILLNNDINPILCIGENLEQRDLNQTFKILANQIDVVFKENIDKRIIIAYEPLWAIGSGLIPTINEITVVINYIKDYIATNYGTEGIKVLYGGSVNSNNVNEIMSIYECDGVLVGTSSFKINDLSALINNL